MTFSRDEMCALHDEGLSYREIARRIGCHPTTVAKAMKSLGRMPPKRTAADVDFFEVINTEEKAYWLGFIVADGNVWRDMLTVRLGIVDIGHLEKLKAALGSEMKIQVRRNKGAKTDHCSFKLSSKKIVSDLAQLGVIPDKCHATYAPLSNIPSDLHRHFWRGVVDGDGWLTYRISRDGYEQRILGLAGSECVVTEFAKLCGSLHPARSPEGYAVTSKAGRLTKQTAVGGREGFWAVADYLYADSGVYLDRKYHAYQTIPR